MRHLEEQLAQEPSPSNWGVATTTGGLNPDANNFLRLGRSIRDDFLNRKINLKELTVLIWLQLDANPHNGTNKISYAGLSEDFAGEYSKNEINKIALALRRKGYLSFPRRQGRRGSFMVHLNNYPLSNGRFTNFKNAFHVAPQKPVGGVSDAELEVNENQTSSTEASAEVLAPEQKLIRSEKSFDEAYSELESRILGGSGNNDNENENKNEKSSQRGKENAKTYGLTDYDSEYEHQRCEEMAYGLGETSMAFILSACAKFGLDVVEEAYNTTLRKAEKGKVDNPGAFFNVVARELGEIELERRRNYHS